MPETSPIPVLRWRCDIARPAPRALQIYRGETARLECLLTLQGAPATIPAGATALIAWQSRDMGASWYTAPATVDVPRGAVYADFTPAMDSGAAEFRAFLRVDGGEGSGICYRAAALLQMLDSPGAEINVLPIPPLVLDFDKVEVLNPPYYTKAEADALLADKADLVNGKVPESQLPPSASGVSSVNGETGDVTLDAADVGALPATATPDDIGALPASVVSSSPRGGLVYSSGVLQLPSSTTINVSDDGLPVVAPDLVAYATRSPVAPSTSTSDSGKLADAYQTGLQLAEKVPTSRTVNGKGLSANIALDSGDISAQVASPAAGSVGAVLELLDSATTALGTSVGAIEGKIPASASASNQCATAADIPSSETWTFTLSGGTTVTKNVAIFV